MKRGIFSWLIAMVLIFSTGLYALDTNTTCEIVNPITGECEDVVSDSNNTGFTEDMLSAQTFYIVNEDKSAIASVMYSSPFGLRVIELGSFDVSSGNNKP